MKEKIVGTRIGIYDVLSECNHKTNDGHKLYRVKCSECGYETDMRLTDIPRTKGCHHCVHSPYKWKNDKLRKIYSGIKTRCYNANDKSYRWYGNKGIKMCEEWVLNPSNFECWALDNGYKDGLTIDRINENENYCAENCRWVTMSDNAKYKSTTRILTVDGVSHTGREWANVLDIGTNVINTMLRSEEEAKVIEFIRRRQKDKTKSRRSRESWFSVYDVN